MRRAAPPGGTVASRLAGGVPVLLRHRPGAPVTSVTVWLLAGSRHEAPALAGATHLLEHVLLQVPLPGGERVVDRLEALGGEGNAITSRDHMVLCARVPAAAAGAAVEALTTSLVAEVPEETVERERQVAVEELRLAAADPADAVHDAFFSAAFPDHPLGHPVGGTPASLAAIPSGRLAAFRAERVHAGTVGVVLCGGGDPGGALAALASSPLADLGLGTPVPAGPAPPAPRRGHRHLALRGDSTGVVVGGQAVPHGHPMAVAWQVLGELLAGGNTSLLFEEVRTKRGLAYDLWHLVTAYRDAGAWRAAMTVAPGHAAEAADLAATLLAGRAERGFTPAEVDAASRRLAGRLRLDVELSLEDALLHGHHALVGGSPGWTLEAHLDALTAVTSGEVTNCAAHAADHLVTATAGPVEP